MTKSKFQTHCEQLVDKLTSEKRAAFKNLESDQEKVKFLYGLSEEVKFPLVACVAKDLGRAEAFKANGNKLFQQRSNRQAIDVYNEAVINCPQDNPEGKKLYAILIANRSAVFFDNAEYNKVLQDVAFLKQFGHHPNPEKLSARETKALDALVKSLDSPDAVIEFEQDGSVRTPLQEELSWVSRNLTYPVLSSKLTVKKDDLQGRYVIAKDDLGPGEIVAVERPYVSVLSSDTYRTNCTHCTLSTNQIHACAQCCQAVYCSPQCREQAHQYHQYECALLSTLYEAGVSVNNLLALRMITQRPLHQVRKDERCVADERNVVIYKTEDYYNVARLVRHEDERDSEELIHLTFMAAFLLKMLKGTAYFASGTCNGDVTRDEVLIGGLLLKYLQIIQYNAHEIFELQNLLDEDRKKMAGDHVQLYKTGDVGAGVYPTLAMFNHSCDPSVTRYNIRNVMVLRAIKPIKAGDVVYENYGPLYTTHAKHERQNKMAANYRFRCACLACVEDWPLFKDFDQDVMRFLCDCGAVVPTSKDIATSSVTCPKCNKDKNLLPVLSSLIPMEQKTNNAENLIVAGDFSEAQKLYCDILGTQLKVLAPPYSDMVLIQNRLKACLVHNGNKKFDYWTCN